MGFLASQAPFARCGRIAFALVDPARDVLTSIELPRISAGALRQFRFLSASRLRMFLGKEWQTWLTRFPRPFRLANRQSIYLPVL